MLTVGELKVLLENISDDICVKIQYDHCCDVDFDSYNGMIYKSDASLTFACHTPDELDVITDGDRAEIVFTNVKY